ncbi:MAG: helix-turn-helix transcriptional regulator [Xanthomonadales bacterium]|nr:helix-turn-helix transcriptional regulator [Xanthomonadales bacterium]
MKTKDVIDSARDLCTPTTYKALAKRLGVEPSAVSNWTNGRAQPDAVSCAKLAEITGIPLARVLGIVGEARAISREEKAVWRRLASAAAITGIMLLAHPAEATLRTALTAAHAMHYAKLCRHLTRGGRQPVGCPPAAAPPAPLP